MIPNHIHFIFFGFTEFAQIHYWAVKSAIAVHRPERVFIHYNQAPKNNPLWNEIAQLVELVYIDPPTEINGIALTSYQYKADVARLEILIKHGGIYLDIDVISLKPFGDLLNKSCVLGVESADGSSYSNAVIMTEPGHPFIIEWLKQTADNLTDQAWAYHAVCLPKQIIDSGTWDVHVEPRESFMPFDFHDESVLLATPMDLSRSYTMHLWETIWWDKLINLSADSVLSTLCKQYNSRLKIAIYTICKNEQKFVDRWANSNSDADLRVVCDTGSTDATVEKLQAQGVTVYNIAVQPWRFDVARGTALNLLPADVDVCIWQDLDEELLPGWRAELESKWVAGTTTANHRYRHNDAAWTWHSKIHARHHCRWTGAVHETLAWNIPEKIIELPQFYLDEHQDTTKIRSNYLDLLLKKIEEGDSNWRTHYFLSNDYQAANQIDLAIEHKKISYELCLDGPIVKAYVAKNIARHYADIGRTAEAEQWFRISTDQSNERESWFSLCEYYYKQQAWDNCYIAAKKCIGITDCRTGFTFDANAWGYLLYDYAALSAYNIGLLLQAKKFGKIALDMNPNDVRLKTNLEFYDKN